ncbi:signal recognition particle subunit SRP19/SEC65 family protein [Candidatus Nitrosocosmicus franklandus]|uniref:Signal recognition particle protein Srp19 n=1 Tax=Candidatus Nitrosocosmicus franklandianus TaxID=1798806 RepID=A0A484IF98_9ARCH|nr:signal recognition particle subunit SRP19/SEC65 family protein [Candidatus Nitrosocosmicus franklandus]VFJ15458.1 Signal recognition particle protein Srp19 [Candidatus Nitrosocosmicus franklandus]
MKDYDSVIIWLDYFNKNLSREKGRKVSRSFAVYDPQVSELVNAIKSLGYTIDKEHINDGARFPKRAHIKSGYVMVEKRGLNKNALLKSISEKIVLDRTRSRTR